MSLTPNPPLDPVSEQSPETPLSALPVRQADAPVWGIIDVLLLASFFVFSLLIGLKLSLTVVHRLPWTRTQSFDTLRQEPLFFLPSQIFSYAVSSLYMVLLVKKKPDVQFSKAIEWNWPRRSMQFIAVGLGLSVLVQLASSILPIPKTLPIDEFFKTSRSLWVLSIFGIFVAPFFEELFFRGFLFPVLYKYMPLFAAIVVDALLFSLFHGAQLAFSWSPMLILFFVGIALTVIRVRTKSVACSVLVHGGYNALLFGLMFYATSGFKHMEKLR